MIDGIELTVGMQGKKQEGSWWQSWLFTKVTAIGPAQPSGAIRRTG